MSALARLGARGAWLFDLDGTLVDTAPDLHAALQHTLAHFGHPPTDYALVREFVGHGARVTIERALTHHDIAPDPADVDRMLERFLDHYGAHIAEASRPFPGVMPTLDALAVRGTRLAVVTNKTEALARALLEALGLDARFETVIGGDTFTERKPHALPLLEACRRLDATPDDALMLGDSITDVSAARAAGMPVVCVRYGYHAPMTPEDLGADALVESLEALL